MKLKTFIFLSPLVIASSMQAQTVRTWTGATGGGWHTTTNWSPSGTFAGEATAAVTGEGTATDIMTVDAANNASNIGINMNTLSGGVGGLALTLGGIDYNKTNTTNTQMGNSSGTVNGLLQLNGATIDGIAKTLIRAAGSANLTIANVNAGTGTQTMGLRLGIKDGIMQVASGRTLTISSNITELTSSSGFTKTGTGLMVVSGTNSYTGGTTISEGSLKFATTASMPSSGAIAVSSGASLIVDVGGAGEFSTATSGAGSFGGILAGVGAGGNSITYSGDVTIGIDVSGNSYSYAGVIANVTGSTSTSLLKINGNNLTLTGANTYTGRTILTGGSLLVSSFGNIADTSSPLGVNSTVEFRSGDITFNGSTAQSSDKIFDITSGNATIRADGTGDGAITLSANFNPSSTASKTLNLFGGNLNDNTISGSISNGAGGVLSVVKNLGGKWVLSGDNSFTGATTISAGILKIQHANALGSTSGGTTVSNGATLQLQGGIITAAEALTLTPGTSGAAMLHNVSGNNTWSGSITSNTTTSTNVSRVQSDAGKLTLAGAVNLTGSAHQLVFQGDGDFAVTGQITGVGRVTSGATGAGVRTLSNDTNSFTGSTTINGGTLAFTSIANVGSASSLGAPALANSVIAFGTTTPSSATLRYVGTETAGHSSNRAINLSSTGNATIEASGAGPLVFNGVNTATGTGSKTLTLGGTNTGNNSIGVIVDNSSTNVTSVTKADGGTWILASTNTYTGATTVSGGKLIVNGSISSSSLTTVDSGAILGGSGTVGKTVVNGTLAVGNSPGVMTFTDTLTLAGSAIMEIDGTSGAGITGGHDFVNLTGAGAAGALTYGGSMTLDIGVLFGLGSYSWNLFDMASETGTFSSITLADQYSGSLVNSSGVWDFASGINTWQFTETTGVLTLNVVPESSVALLGSIGLLVLLRRRRA